MFNKTKEFIKRVGVKMGLIKEIAGINNFKKINVSDSFYEDILTWKNLHKGYDKNIHEVNAFSLAKGQHTRKLATLNVPKLISQEIATLIFNERCEISITANDSFKELVEDVFKRNNFNGNFQQYLEFMFAHGGMAIKPYLNVDKIDLSYSLAENFIPISWDNDKIKEGLFITVSVKDKKYYKLLEWHTFNNEGLYTVRNELYTSNDPNKIGVQVPLSNLYPDLVEEVTFSPQVDRPLFVYFKPNTANNIENDSPLGISIYANAIDTLRMIDTIYDSFIREYKLGRKRMIVSTQAIKHVNNRDGSQVRYFDALDETYEAFDGSLNDNEVMKEVNSTLRVNEHVAGLNTALDTIATQIGFSPGTFSFNASGGLKTATEVVSENSKTFRTKKSHENLIESNITELIQVIGLLADEAGLVVNDPNLEVSVFFDDSIIQDKTAEIDNEIKLVGVGLQSKVAAIMNIFGLTRDEAIEKLREIIAEQRDELPDMQTIIDDIAIGGDFE